MDVSRRFFICGLGALVPCPGGAFAARPDAFTDGKPLEVGA